MDLCHERLQSVPALGLRICSNNIIRSATFIFTVEPPIRTLRERDNLPTKDTLLDPFPIAVIHFYL